MAAPLQALNSKPTDDGTDIIIMIDGAIVEALGLDASRSDMVPHGNSAFSSTFKLATVTDGDRRMLFVKTAAGNEAGRMFAGSFPSSHKSHVIYTG